MPRRSDDKTGDRVPTQVRVIGPLDGDILGAVSSVRDRFMISGEDSGGGFSLVEHLMPPRCLAAPLHRHSREDEYSYVLEGRVGAVLEGAEVLGEAGCLGVWLHMGFKKRATT